MKKSIYIVLAIAALTLQACQLIEESFKIGLTATMEPTAIATKTSLSPIGTSGYDVLWSAGDKIGVYIDGATTPTPFTLTSGAGTTTASFAGEGVGSSYLAIYPQSMLSSRSGNTVNITIPSEQTYVPGSFDEDTYPMVASSGTSQLQFRNICSIVRISLIGSQTVSKIVFQTNDPSVKVSGAASVNVSSPSSPTITMADNASDNVVLNTGSVQLSDTPTDFYLVLPPQTYTGGFTVRVYSGDDYIEKSYDSDFTMVRSMVHRAAVFSFDAPTMVNKYLTFTSEGSTTISLANNGGNAPLLYYSYDQVNWTQWDYSELTFTSNSPLFLCGDNPTGFSSDWRTNSSYSQFISDGDLFGISGDIMSLISKEKDVIVIPCDYCFYSLFGFCTNLLSGPDLSATTLSEGCYLEMFYECSGLTIAPDLPATILTDKCYALMFVGCTSLDSAPALPAMTLASNCYISMFAHCIDLSGAPQLPATSLADYCYAAMFEGCTSLMGTPILVATTLAPGCYNGMFRGCTSLTDAPGLPATELEENCYGYMFAGCTNLTEAPVLPATTLAPGCYNGLFSGCTSLTGAPNLPATEMAENCYGYMFAGCTSLTTAPALPATALAPSCYMMMFSDCSSLITAPDLPATLLASGCYYYMFLSCGLLETAPVLPAPILTDRCYEGMFAGCSSLNYIKCLATDISAEDCLRSWVADVSLNGIFVKDESMNDWSYGYDGIPNGWTIQNDGQTPITANKYLTFTSEGTTLLSLLDEMGNEPLLYYSYDQISWIKWDYSELSFTSSKPVYICGDNPSGINKRVDIDHGWGMNCSTFAATGDYFSVSGDIMSLIDKDYDVSAIPCNCCFSSLFNNCTLLIGAPELSAKVLTDYCYNGMFAGCSNLTIAPELPATELSESCYAGMFSYCTNLSKAPDLPAVTLATECYGAMFENCTSLIVAPELPATTLADLCYAFMFENCTSLASAPALPATTLAVSCYIYMFHGCISLTETPTLPATILAEACYANMFNGCSSLTAAHDLPATTLADWCYNEMFLGCSSISYVKSLATDINAVSCTLNWLSGVSGTGTFVKAASMNDWARGPSGIPTGWTVNNDGDIPSGGLEGTDEEDWN